MDNEFDIMNNETIEIEMYYYDDEDVEHHQHEANGNEYKCCDQIVPDINNLK
jgi:hypothetical protein